MASFTLVTASLAVLSISSVRTQRTSSDLDLDECGRAPRALREALEYMVLSQDVNSDGVIEPRDVEWDNILVDNGGGREVCRDPDNCPFICVTTKDEWVTGLECYYGFDRGYLLTIFDYFDVNKLPFLPAEGDGDGVMLNRDLKASPIGTDSMTTTEYRAALAKLFREYCASNAQGRYCDQLSDIADF